MVISWTPNYKCLYSSTIIQSLAFIISFIIRVVKWVISVKFTPIILSILLASVISTNQNQMKGVIWRVKLQIFPVTPFMLDDNYLKAGKTILDKIINSILMISGAVRALFLCFLLFFLTQTGIKLCSLINNISKQIFSTLRYYQSPKSHPYATFNISKLIYFL